MLPGASCAILCRGELAQLFVNQREQFLSRIAIALLNALEDLGDIAHEPELIWSTATEEGEK